MSIRCRCPNCSATYKVADEAAGKRIKCAKCATVFPVAAVDESSPAGAAPSSTVLPTAKPTASSTALPRAVPTSGNTQATNPNPAATPFPQHSNPPTSSSSGIQVNVGPTVNTGGIPSFSTAPTTSSPGSPAPSFAKKPNNLMLPLMLGGGGVLAVLMLVVGWLVLGSGGGNAKSTKTAGKTGTSSKGDVATLVIDWPESERSGAKLMIDHKNRSFPPSGPIEVQMSPGKHHLSILRRGFEPYAIDVQLSAGDRTSQRPSWKEIPVIASNVPNSTSGTSSRPGPQITPDTGTSFQIGGAVVPNGFEGWEQSLIKARELAAQSKKDILLLFGSSDGSPATARAADVLRQAGLPGGEMASKIVPVVIDFPATIAGRDKVADLVQNVELARKFDVSGIGESPTLILMDEQARPYAIQRELPKGGASAWPQSITQLQSERSARDALLSQSEQGSPADRLKGAGAFVKWLQDHDFETYYSVEIANWYVQATQLDPKNELGVLELFPEAQLRCQLQSISRGNVVELVRLLGRFDNWLTTTMKDQDRGARMHLILGTIFSQIGEEKEGFAHFERAAIYMPKDEELAEQVRGIKSLVDNKDVSGSGSGFVIAEGGYILTNRHVIEGDGEVQVRIPSVAQPVPAKVIAIGTRDMALIKAEFPADFKPQPIPLATGKLGRGLEVAAYGYPRGDALGRGLKFSKGAISDLPNQALDNMILLDLRINPGNSGGPLCCGSGEVIGMVTAKTGSDFDVDSYGMAIPAEELVDFLDQALPEGVKRATAEDESEKSWDKISQQVTPGILMILKLRE